MSFYVPANFNFQSSPPRAFDFLKKFWSNSRYVDSLDGQIPHRLELQRASNPPPSRYIEATIQKFSLKNYLTEVSLISIKMFFLESFLESFFKGSQILQQNCEYNKRYISIYIKYSDWSFLVYFLIA